MKIRSSKNEDVTAIMHLIHQAQSYFKDNQIDQWQDGYPDNQRIFDDIALDHSYVLEDNHVIGTMYFALEVDPCYEIIDGKWITQQQPYALIHRIVVDQNKKGQNLASLLLEYVIHECKLNNIKSIRIDTHKDNLSMQRFLYKNGFQLCGVITLESGALRNAFEKIIE